jgi:hypothetical protein
MFAILLNPTKTESITTGSDKLSETYLQEPNIFDISFNLDFVISYIALRFVPLYKHVIANAEEAVCISVQFLKNDLGILKFSERSVE